MSERDSRFLAFDKYMEAKGGAHKDCLPVPTERNQGWPGVYAVLYTDTINDQQTCRDDLWMATTGAIESLEHEAYAEGRSDQAQEVPMPPRALELLDQALSFAQEVWSGGISKDDREGLAFNLRSELREYLIEIGREADDLTRSTHARSMAREMPV